MIRKGIKNIFSSFGNQLITMALGIVIPRLVLVSLGSEANGLLNSVSQVLIYLSLLEAGIGTATSQALYAPIRRKDQQSINEILAATDKFYKKTGALYFLGIMAMTILYPMVVETDIPTATVVIVILLSGMTGVINYFFQGKYRILLQAEGKGYLLTNLGTIMNIVTSIGKIVLLLKGYGIVSLQILYFAVNTAQMLYVIIHIKKYYKWLDLTVQPNLGALNQKRAILVHQISGMIFNNTDMVILSMFEGLKSVSVYSMYNMIYGMINTACSNIITSVTFAFGQIYNTDKKQYIKMHDAFEVYYQAINMGLLCTAYILILPFLSLYTEGITDINYIDKKLSVLFVILILLSNGRVASGMLISYAGHFDSTKWRSVIETCINLIVSIIGVRHWGIYGVLVGTIAALLYRTNDMIIYSSVKLLNRSPFVTYKRWIINSVLFVVLSIIGQSIIGTAKTSYLIWFMEAIVTFVAVIAVFLLVGSLTNKESYVYVKEICKDKLGLK